MTDEECGKTICINGLVFTCMLRRGHHYGHKSLQDTYFIEWENTEYNVDEHDPKMCAGYTCLCECNNCMVHHWMGL